jgi:hypothetical protein
VSPALSNSIAPRRRARQGQASYSKDDDARRLSSLARSTFHSIKINRTKEGIHEVIVCCKAHPDDKVLDGNSCGSGQVDSQLRPELVDLASRHPACLRWNGRLMAHSSVLRRIRRSNANELRIVAKGRRARLPGSRRERPQSAP